MHQPTLFKTLSALILSGLALSCAIAPNPAAAQFGGGRPGGDGLALEKLPACLKSSLKQATGAGKEASADVMTLLEALKTCPPPQQRDALSTLRPKFIKQGNEWLESENFEPAEAVFSQMALLDPKDAMLQYKLGNALFRQQKTDAAIAAYQQATRLDADQALARNGLGIALTSQGKYDEAIAEYRAALKINPTYADALGNLGVALIKKGQPAEAVAPLEQAKGLFKSRQEFQMVRQIDTYLQQIRARSPQSGAQSGAGMKP
jgi:Flp pilus assembly protein TadD